MLLALAARSSLIALVYVVGSAERRADNPDDKLLPPVAEMADAVRRVAFEPDRRSGEIVLWADTAASLRRLALGLGIATLIGLALGLAIGVLPLVARDAARRWSRCISHDPADGDPAGPVHRVRPRRIVEGGADRDRRRAVPGARPGASPSAQLPVEQLVKAQTLGASTWQVAIRVVLPQVMPRLIEAVRLSLGPAFLFLISAEAIAAESGLGYRIFLVRRYLAMDVILPYVAWITLLAYVDGLRAGAPVARGVSLGARGGAALMSAISVRDVWVEYGDQIVLERINLEIASGAFVSIVGPSGCGKSTFLRLILGQERPTRGTILLDGEPLPDEPGPDRGVVFQRYSVFPHLTVLGNVLVGFEFAAARCWRACIGAARRDGDRAERCAARRRSGSEPHRDKYPSALSGGMQQRLAIAQALARAPARAAARRAVRRARSRHARADARADPPALARARHDRPHGHPRHQGSASRSAPA